MNVVLMATAKGKKKLTLSSDKFFTGLEYKRFG